MVTFFVNTVNSMEDKKERRRFDRALLDECIQRDGATLIGEYEKLHGRIQIYYICKCGKNNNKRFDQMLNNIGLSCKECTAQIRLANMKKTNIERYGVENPSLNKEIRNKQKITCLERYGSESPLKNTIIINKIKQTNIEKFGNENPFASNEIKQKIKETNIKKFGVENPNKLKEFRKKIVDTNLKKYGSIAPIGNTAILEKINKTNIEKYGVNFPLQHKDIFDKTCNTNKEKCGFRNPLESKEVREKAKNTMLDKYGVEHPCQSQEIQEKQQKNAKKYKEYKFPSGQIRKVQGYEPFALDCLVKTYTEDQIKTDRKDVPRIQYEVEGKKKYYFPDIFIPHENKLIEVKSTWTYKCKTDNILQKGEACKAQGYLYEIWCFDAKGNRIDV